MRCSNPRIDGGRIQWNKQMTIQAPAIMILLASMFGASVFTLGLVTVANFCYLCFLTVATAAS
jgi:hypothetical protein